MKTTQVARIQQSAFRTQQIAKSQILTTLLVLTSCLNPTAAGAESYNKEQAEVTWVVDGDTLKVRLINQSREETVRVLGIDCPESFANDKCIARNGGKAACERNEVPKGKRAKKYAMDLFRRGRKNVKVVLETPRGGEERDKYGRKLAYIRMPNGQDYGYVLVKKELCDDYSHKYPHPRQAKYKAAR
jgi:endonuclease YncB( thermonuclease family)